MRVQSLLADRVRGVEVEVRVGVDQSATSRVLSAGKGSQGVGG
jgi:hypothetical protein